MRVFAMLAACAAVSPVAANAASVFGDEFEFFARSNSFFVENTLTASLAGPDETVDNVVSTAVQMSLTFTDDNSFFVQHISNPSFSDTYIVELTGLDFTENGAPAPITSFGFDASETNILDFDSGSDFSLGPLSFTENSVSLQYTIGSTALSGDQPEIHFDIGFGASGGDDGPSPVPLPATGLLLVAGLGTLRLIRRR